MKMTRCVCCGGFIPDGASICPTCREDVESGVPYQMPSINRLEDVSVLLKSWANYASHSHKNRAYDPAFAKLNMLFPAIASRMAAVIDAALLDGEQISMEECITAKQSKIAEMQQEKK